MSAVRVRFAPSPTGALHIGGLRTALYNYLFAKQNGGTFILRIEDTDQKRFVAGAEEYIQEALDWCGIAPDEGPRAGGNYGPYRQSERRDLYAKYSRQLLEDGRAYYAFDTEEELNDRREAEKAAGNHNFRYDATTRAGLRNSLTLGKQETERLLMSGTPYTVRLLVEPGDEVTFADTVRDQVTFSTDEVDDKVLMKADGLPTYHLANVVDDHLMEISHVIRGEEWLPSTALHVLLYRALGWADTMPKFAHLPLLLKPTGKGKLSKRDGQKLGIPVFPLSWDGGAAAGAQGSEEGKSETLLGFREAGFLPEATVNFLALLGWNPGTEQEIFSLEELIQTFDAERINKSGARFDYDKARWFNQQYLIAASDETLAPRVRAQFAEQGTEISPELAMRIAGLLKERVHVLPEFYEQGTYFVAPPAEYDEKTARKKWKPERRAAFDELVATYAGQEDWTASAIKETTVAFMEKHGLNFGAVLPILRIAASGSTQGPDAFAMLETIGREETVGRLRTAYDRFDALKS